ncbi:hypothetical protein RIF29_03971 [Crotalaria pallida]|uniref:3,4-dihydroxy-2-butanone-4-phosphate synthase n=1 Tax=Crotalaria pallida TaxID=3830 RepID=A0AAN9J312_CROPI
MARLPKLRQADATLIRYDFSDDTNEFDLDKPTPGFASIPEAIEDIRQGKMVMIVDDEDRENEGDLIVIPYSSCELVGLGLG